MKNKIIEANKLCKNYEHLSILKDINLTIYEGEFIAIMGPSGSGKSTLLYILSALEKITSGSVKLNGVDISKLNEHELVNVRLEKIGFVFQQINLLKNLNVMDNIIIPGYLNRKNNKQIINDKAKEYLKIMNLSEIEQKEITNISGGEMQRVAIARALINNPDIVFLDEPTGALNSKAASEVLDILNQLNKSGKTFLMVTHDIKVAARASKIIYLSDGELKGSLELKQYNDLNDKAEREKIVSKYLLEMGW